MELKHEGLDNEVFGNEDWWMRDLVMNILGVRVVRSITRLHWDTPLFLIAIVVALLGNIVFRALGFVADKDILEHICYDFSDVEMMELLRPSLEEAFVIQNQQVYYIFEFEFMFLMYMDIDSNSYLFFRTSSSNHLCKHPDRCNKLAFNFRREIQ